MGISLALSGLLPATGIVPFVILFGLFGFFVPWQSSPLTALIQSDIEPRLLGRVFALMGAFNVLPALSLAAVGFLADNIGVTNTFFLSGVGIGIIGILGFFTPSIMNLEKKGLR